MEKYQITKFHSIAAEGYDFGFIDSIEIFEFRGSYDLEYDEEGFSYSIQLLVSGMKSL